MKPAFKVYVCNECSAYYEIYFADSREELYAELKERFEYENDKMTAVCITENESSGDLMGYIYYQKVMMGAGYVTHELAHAAFRSVERHGLDVSTEAGEERFCQTLEYMNAQFWREAYERKLAQPQSYGSFRSAPE